jgi:DNA-directed RNA polymerase subunit RPC12/RpoP
MENEIKNINNNPKKKLPSTICPVCGSKILKMNKPRHERTKKHKDAQYILHDRLEFVEFK